MQQLPLFDAVEIPLTKGYTALVDPVDADLLQYKWSALVTDSGGVYARRGMPEGSTESTLMHRLILGRMLGRTPLRKEETDHKDNDGLNNRRSNLRLATSSNNKHNTRKPKNNTSGFKGVHFDPRTGRWRARITVNNKLIGLGRHDTPELAYAAYCAAAKHYFGEFARME